MHHTAMIDLDSNYRHTGNVTGHYIIGCFKKRTFFRTMQFKSILLLVALSSLATRLYNKIGFI